MGTHQSLEIHIYVDVDDTLIRSFGTKRIPIPKTIALIKRLKERGATLYCWSSGGAEYAKRTAEELHIAEFFVFFLPKPNILIDDQKVINWRSLKEIHPMSIDLENLDSYIDSWGLDK